MPSRKPPDYPSGYCGNHLAVASSAADADGWAASLAVPGPSQTPELTRLPQAEQTRNISCTPAVTLRPATVCRRCRQGMQKPRTTAIAWRNTFASNGIACGARFHARAWGQGAGVHSQVPPVANGALGPRPVTTVTHPGAGGKAGCDGGHTGVWAISQPDVTLGADTKFVPVRAGSR